jgi:hypothetical protein
MTPEFHPQYSQKKKKKQRKEKRRKKEKERERETQRREDILTISYRIKHTVTMQSNELHSDTFLNELETCSHKNVYSSIYSSSIHNFRNVKVNVHQ